jgi:N-acyl-phosphatidylethanolamine-hydrolysing phospholipase D
MARAGGGARALDAGVRRAVFLVCFIATTAGARPPHHTDDGFRNVVEVELAGPDVTLPFFARRVWASLVGRSGAPPVVPNDGAFLRTNAHHSVPTVTWVGHSTLLVQMDGVTFLTDPIWSERASPLSFAGPKRYVPPGIAFDALPPIDFVVVSHSHYDHTDLPTLVRLAETGTRIFVPLRLGDVLRGAGIANVEELDWWDARTVGDVTIHCTPAQHWSARSLGDRNRTLWSGWAVVGRTRRFYYAGDTGYFAGFADVGARIGPFDLAAVPIGAYEPVAMMRPHHMNPEEALRAALDVGAARAIGVHYGTFDLTDEPLDEPPRRFHEAARSQHVDDERVWTPPIGATRQF